MDPLKHIAERFGVRTWYPKQQCPSPIEIPNSCRDDLPTLFAELGYSVGAEIGVYRGEYTERLAHVVTEPRNGVLLGVDPWCLPRPDWVDFPQEKLTEAEGLARARLARFTSVRLVKALSADAVQHIPRESLDFVYLDGDHTFASVAHDLQEWTLRVRKGGIVAGHDYVYPHNNRFQVIPVLHAYVQAFRVRPWFVLGTKAMVPGHKRDIYRSFFWVR